ncbi:MAG: hypothetical protein D6823_01380 [Chloroflexi bacterium]|jgi:hypothetical protein|nr:MAG: hypothetical protein D6823_01380 [Chloroflexota bacterium]
MNITPYMFQWPFGTARFEEIINSPEVLITHLNESLKDNFNHRLASVGIGNGSVMLVQAVEWIASEGKYTVVFSQEGQRLLKLRQAILMGNGTRPILMGSNGRIVEIGRLSQIGSHAVSLLTTAVVAVAHIIATADLVHRIEQIRQDVNWLRTARQIDQWAKVERIFYAARELCARPIDQRARMELWQMRHELHELRVVLRREWQAKIEEITAKLLRDNQPLPREWQAKIEEITAELLRDNQPLPREWQAKIEEITAKLLSGLPLIRDYLDPKQQKQKEITQALDQTLDYPFMIELGWRLDHVLAVASQTEQEFWGTIGDELHAVAQIVQTIAERGQQIELQYWLVEPYSELVEHYRQLSQHNRLAQHSA